MVTESEKQAIRAEFASELMAILSEGGDAYSRIAKVLKIVKDVHERGQRNN